MAYCITYDDNFVTSFLEIAKNGGYCQQNPSDDDEI